MPLFLILLPILLMASVFDGQRTFRFGGSELNYSGWRLSQEIISYVQAGVWIPSGRIIPSYNPSIPARVDSVSWDYWDEEAGAWITEFMKAQLEYNAAGRVVSNQIRANFFGMMVNVMKLTATYDSQNRLTHFYMYEPDPDVDGPGALIISSRYHIIYGGGTAFEIHGWHTGNYEEGPTPGYFHSTFTFDARGRIAEELSFASPDSTNWVADGRTTHTYHAQDTSTGADFIEHLSQNMPMLMISDEFEVPGLITTTVDYWWNDTEWVSDYRTTNQYNDQLLRTVTVEDEYSDSQWNLTGKQLYYYDANALLSLKVFQASNGVELVDDDRHEYSWEPYTTANDDPVLPKPELAVKAYPNPFNKELSIEPSSASKAMFQVSIHNLRGQCVQSYQSSGGQSLSWDGKAADGSSSPAGIYFIRVLQDGREATAKVVRIK